MASTWIALQVLREKDGQTIADLARKAGVARGHLCDLENGKRTATPKVIYKLAKALNVPLSMLERPRDIGPEPQDEEPDVAACGAA